MVFRMSSWSGWDSWRNYLPDKWQARAAAKKLLKRQWSGIDPKTQKLVIETVSGAFRVIDRAGSLEPTEHEEIHGCG